MLTLYRRHSADCPKKDERYWRRCKCPVWAQGTVEGVPVHRSLKTRSWERAADISRKIENGEKERVSVPEAGRQFNADAERRGLSRSQREKYRLLVREIEAFAEAFKVWNVAEFDVAKVREYVTTWKLAPITTAKKLERLRSFFRFCMDSGWITRNPAKVVKAPRVKPNPTLPFSDEEVERMLAVAEPRMKSLILVLTYSGLRIGDTVQLTVDKVKDGKIFLYSQKTGVPVWVPVPQFVVDSLPEPRGGITSFSPNRRARNPCMNAGGRSSWICLRRRRLKMDTFTGSETPPRFGGCSPEFQSIKFRFSWPTATRESRQNITLHS